MQKYALNIILIQKNINKISDLEDLIRKKIDNYQENSMMATNLNELVMYSEEIYKEYIGIIRPRVVISGKKRIFRKEFFYNKSFIVEWYKSLHFCGTTMAVQNGNLCLEEKKFSRNVMNFLFNLKQG